MDRLAREGSENFARIGNYSSIEKETNLFWSSLYY